MTMRQTPTFREPHLASDPIVDNQKRQTLDIPSHSRCYIAPSGSPVQGGSKLFPVDGQPRWEEMEEIDKPYGSKSQCVVHCFSISSLWGGSIVSKCRGQSHVA